jgi:hypothetical protein
VLVAELVPPGGQELGQESQVTRTAHVVTHRVQLERQTPQTQPGEEIGGQRDDLDVEVGVGRTERFHPELVVLAVATGLGPLMAEGRGDIPGLPGDHRVVLDEGPDDRGGAFGPQGQQLPVAVGEFVHLLPDDLAALADTPVEDLGVLEERALDQSVAGPLDEIGEPGDDELPPPGLRPENVVRASRCSRRGASPPALFRGHGLSPSCRAAGGRRRRRRRGAST